MTVQPDQTRGDWLDKVADPERSLAKDEAERRRRDMIAWLRRDAADRSGGAEWYVAESVGRCPIRIEADMKAHDIEAWCPVENRKVRRPRTHHYRRADVPVFERYLFVRVPPAESCWLAIETFDGVAGLLGVNGRPQAIDEKIVNDVRMFLGLTKKQRRLLCDVVQVGDRIKIKGGSFDGFPADVLAVDGNRGLVDIEVSIFGRMTPVTLGLDQIKLRR